MHSYWLHRLLVCGLCQLILALDRSTLRQVNIITRHGARSPTNPFPNDPYKDHWPQGYGQLTQVGMQQMYELGAFLREHYAGFINHTYINDELYVRSSNYDRTLMSAESFLAGLYPPPAGDAAWMSGINWQPVPVHTVSPETDILLDMDNPVCPPYDKMKEDIHKTESFQRRNASYEAYYQRLKNYTGKTDDMDPFGVWDIYDCIYAEQNENLPIAPWFTEQDEELMSDLFIPWQFDINFGGFQKGRLKGGPLITEMVENMRLYINGTISPPRRKAFFYIGHDNNIITTMKVTQTFNERYVPVASHLALELHQVNNQYFLQMLFRNSSTQNTPYVINITVCDGKSTCPFEDFVAAVQPYFITPETWFQECSSKDVTTLSLAGIICLTIGAVIVFVLIIGIILYLCKVPDSGVVVKQSNQSSEGKEKTPLLIREK